MKTHSENQADIVSIIFNTWLASKIAMVLSITDFKWRKTMVLLIGFVCIPVE
jgi:hypothetical protein